AARYRGTPGTELRDWLRAARRHLLTGFAAIEPSRRLPWYGPDMSAASSVTARLMETWAHGQDIADALGVTRQPTARLRHVAHIGVNTIGFSFALRSLPPPDQPIRVELTGPGGEEWTWGPPGADNVVRAPALDFCLVVTQRRHPADTALVAEGSLARQWISIAQAFAGAPGPGRPPSGVPLISETSSPARQSPEAPAT
ncbi:MAG TPA: TIGR03084 family metal-binding protein, partial [Streptosporangiaceae bacterium]|nr:TIGR03084 family metal-binding protein [Streptosporangiaceae bacterium]